MPNNEEFKFFNFSREKLKPVSKFKQRIHVVVHVVGFFTRTEHAARYQTRDFSFLNKLSNLPRCLEFFGYVS
jgi:hypothetical protein